MVDIPIEYRDNPTVKCACNTHLPQLIFRMTFGVLLHAKKHGGIKSISIKEVD